MVPEVKGSTIVHNTQNVSNTTEEEQEPSLSSIIEYPDTGIIITDTKVLVLDLGFWQTGTITTSTTVTTHNIVLSLWSDRGAEISTPNGMIKIHVNRTGLQMTQKITPNFAQQKLNNGDRQSSYYTYSIGVDMTEGVIGSVTTSVKYNQNTITTGGVSITNSTGQYYSTDILQGTMVGNTMGVMMGAGVLYGVGAVIGTALQGLRPIAP